MAEDGAVLPGALPPESFFGRSAELRRLSGEARALLRGRGRSRAICARPGAGKTELLLQWHGRLFREGEVIPLYFAVPPGGEPRRVAASLVWELALQALAFARRDPALLSRPPARSAVASGLSAVFGGAGASLVEELSRSQGAEGDLQDALLAPHRLSVAAGVPVLFMLDDAGNLAADGRRAILSAAAAASTRAPLLLALAQEGELARLLGHDAAAAVTLEPLDPLSPAAIRQLARSLARSAGLALGEEAVAALERECAGSPFYLDALLRALEREPGLGATDVARASARAVCDGELARYWLERLTEQLPARELRATAIEILAFCLREEDDPPEAARLAERMLKAAGEVEAAIAALCAAGLLRVDCARITVDADPVFRDAVLALYRREFERTTPAVVAGALAAAKARGDAEAGGAHAALRFREGLRSLLLAWQGQQVPRAAFDPAAGTGTGGSTPGGEEAPEVTLPRVLSVAAGRVGAAGSPAACDLDALAWGTRDVSGAEGTDVAWAARRLPGGAGAAAQLAAFDRQLSALQGAGELPAARLVRWALLDAPLDAAGAREASRLRLMTSTAAQLASLAEALGVPAPEWPAARGVGAALRLEMEMIIPRAADAELVAARALEQLAENLGMSPEDGSRVKTALVEACINAFEHSGDREGRVRLWFGVRGERLLIRVENRGRPLVLLPDTGAAGDQPRRRGWGLTLMRRLLDEVRVEPREDGVSLLLEKRLVVPPHG